MQGRIVSQQLANCDDENSADDGPGPQALATDDDDRQHVDCPLQSEHAIRFDRAEFEPLQGPGHAHQETRHHKHDQLDAKSPHTDLGGCILVITHRAQENRKARTRQQRHQGGGQAQQGQRDQVELEQSGRVLRQKKPGGAAQAVVVDHEHPRRLGQRQCANREIQTPHAEHCARHQGRQQGRTESRQRHGQPDRQAGEVHQDGEPISADAEETGRPERDQPAVAGQEIPGFCQRDEQQDSKADLERVVRQHRGNSGQQAKAQQQQQDMGPQG